MKDFNLQQVAFSVWAFTKVGHQDEQLFTELAVFILLLVPEVILTLHQDKMGLKKLENTRKCPKCPKRPKI